MDQISAVAGLPSVEELRKLNTINRGRIAIDILLLWSLILGSIQLATQSESIALSALLFVLIGCFQNGLITWVHEASHCNLHRNKKLNDIFSDIVLCGPTGVSVDQYRWHHFAHHRNLGDPEKEIELAAWTCIRGRRLFVEIFKHLTGYYGFQIARRRKRFSQPDSKFPPPPSRSIPAWIGFVVGNAGIFAMCALQGKWYLYFVMWVAPLFTIALLISNFRTIVEHQANSNICDLGFVRMPSMTRSVNSNFLERFLVAPVGFYFHSLLSG